MPALSAPPHITAPPDLWYHRGPSLDIHIHLVLVNQNRSQCSRCLTSAEKGLITSFDLLATLFQTQPKIPFTYFAARVHCWLTFNLLNRTTRAFSAKLLSRQSDPILSQYSTLLLPKCRALHFPLFSFTEQSPLLVSPACPDPSAWQHKLCDLQNSYSLAEGALCPCSDNMQLSLPKASHCTWT